MNLYAPTPPEQHSVDFDELLREDFPPNQSTSSTWNIAILHSTFVVVSRKYRPSSVPTSPLYITKLREDVVDDNEETCYVKMTWYTQDFDDPLLFNNTGEEFAIPKEAIKEIVNNIRVTFQETLAIDEDKNYLLLALLNGSVDYASPNLLRRLLRGKKTWMIHFARRLVDHKGSERRHQTMCLFY